MATAVAYDPENEEVVESPYSAELGARPLLLDTTIRDLPSRTTIDVQETLIDEILSIIQKVFFSSYSPSQ